MVTDSKMLNFSDDEANLDNTVIVNPMVTSDDAEVATNVKSTNDRISRRKSRFCLAKTPSNSISNMAFNTRSAGRITRFHEKKSTSARSILSSGIKYNVRKGKLNKKR